MKSVILKKRNPSHKTFISYGIENKNKFIKIKLFQTLGLKESTSFRISHICFPVKPNPNLGTSIWKLIFPSMLRQIYV